MVDKNGTFSKQNHIVGPCIGIDLGTTYSCVAVWKNGRVEVCPNEQANRITPSQVAWTPDGQRVVGDAAKNQTTSNPLNTVFDVKRLIGRKFSDSSVQKDSKLLPFRIIAATADKPAVEVKTGDSVKAYSPEEISAMVLQKVKELSESLLGEPVHHAVVTVPAYFNDAQRQATKDAGTVSILRRVTSKVPPPKSKTRTFSSDSPLFFLSIPYAIDAAVGSIKTRSIFSPAKGLFESKATAGDTHLGGEDFDQRLMDYCIAQFKKNHSVD